MAITAHEIGKDLIEALGLPKVTRAFALHVRAGECVRVECEYYPSDGKAITTALTAYDLVPRFRRAPVASPPSEPVHFDTWYRNRINAAHSEFIERTSRRPACDWLAFPPDAIERYLDGSGV